MVETDLGLLSCCWSRRGLLSRCCRFGFDCDCVVETGLGLLSRCTARTGSVIPLPKQGRVCYPAAGNSILLVSERLRLGCVLYPRCCYVEENFTKLGACIAEVFECSRKRDRLRRDRLT